MVEDLITPENLTKELLKSALDAAFMNTVLDSDGDLIVKDEVNCLVIPDKDLIRMRSTFRFKPETPELARLQAVNRINYDYKIVKAVMGSSDVLGFVWEIPLSGGITKKTFILALKRFCSIPQAAIRDCADGIVS